MITISIIFPTCYTVILNHRRLLERLSTLFFIKHVAVACTYRALISVVAIVLITMISKPYHHVIIKYRTGLCLNNPKNGARILEMRMGARCSAIYKIRESLAHRGLIYSISTLGQRAQDYEVELS